VTTTIGERLIHIRGDESREKFSEQVRVHKNTLGNYERNDRPPDVGLLQMLYSFGWNINWVLTGMGAERRTEIDALALEMSNSVVYLPLYDAQAAAGSGNFIEQHNIKRQIPFNSYLIDSYLHANAADLLLFEVDGDSMADKIKPDDIIMVNTAVKNISGGVYAFTIGNTLMCKHLQSLPGNMVQVSSENKAYAPFTIDMEEQGEEFEVIGRVIWHSGRT